MVSEFGELFTTEIDKIFYFNSKYESRFKTAISLRYWDMYAN